MYATLRAPSVSTGSAHGVHCYSDSGTLVCGWPQWHAGETTAPVVRLWAMDSRRSATPLRDRMAKVG